MMEKNVEGHAELGKEKMTLTAIMDKVHDPNYVMTPEWAREAFVAIDAAKGEQYKFTTEAPRGMKFSYGDAYVHHHSLKNEEVYNMLRYEIGKRYLHGTNVSTNVFGRARFMRWLETGETPLSFDEFITKRGLDKSYLSGRAYEDYLNSDQNAVG